MLGQILAKHKVEGITLRNDNGSQIIATVIWEYLQEQGVNQEFTHVATPEENSFIEAYHSLLERTIEQRYEFESIYEAGICITYTGRVREWVTYNQQRIITVYRNNNHLLVTPFHLNN